MANLSLAVVAAGALVASTLAMPADASTLLTENFSASVPGSYGVGDIANTQFKVTSGNIDIIGVLNGNAFNCVDDPAGNCLDTIGNTGFGSVSSISTFNLVAGATYEITLDANAQGDVGDIDFTVTLGSFSQTLTSTPNGGIFDLTYMPATDESGVSLTFTTPSPPDTVHGAVIDNIVLTETLGNSTPPDNGVPEPASLALFGAGLAGLSRLRRIRKV